METFLDSCSGNDSGPSVPELFAFEIFLNESEVLLNHIVFSKWFWAWKNNKYLLIPENEYP